MTGGTRSLRVDWIDTALWPGRLGLTSIPGRTQRGAAYDRELAADLDSLARQGVSVLALLTGAHGLDLLNTPGEQELAGERGLSVVACPVSGRAVPDDLPTFSSLLDELMEHLLDGRTVVVHGEAGPGLTAACLLTQVGMPPEQATWRVREARPGAIESAGQEQFVHDFASR